MLQVDCILHSHTHNRVHAYYKYCIQQRPRNFLESGLKINEKIQSQFCDRIRKIYWQNGRAALCCQRFSKTKYEPAILV